MVWVEDVDEDRATHKIIVLAVFSFLEPVKLNYPLSAPILPRDLINPGTMNPVAHNQHASPVPHSSYYTIPGLLNTSYSILPTIKAYALVI
jgi:hypothetical protein